jgi:hypothetical protein
MIPTTVTHPTGWLTAAALGALAVLFVVLTPAGFDLGRMSQQSILEYCRAEVTRAFLVKYQATAPRSFEDCMTRVASRPTTGLQESARGQLTP